MRLAAVRVNNSPLANHLCKPLLFVDPECFPLLNNKADIESAAVLNIVSGE